MEPLLIPSYQNSKEKVCYPGEKIEWLFTVKGGVPLSHFINWTLTVFSQYFWPFYCLFLGQRNPRATLLVVYWHVVRGYRWMTSLYDFLHPRAQIRRQRPVPKNCKTSLLPVPASKVQKKLKSSSPTGTREPGTKEPKTKSSAGR